MKEKHREREIYFITVRGSDDGGYHSIFRVGAKQNEGEEEEDEGRRTNLSWGFVKLIPVEPVVIRSKIRHLWKEYVVTNPQQLMEFEPSLYSKSYDGFFLDK